MSPPPTEADWLMMVNLVLDARAAVIVQELDEAIVVICHLYPDFPIRLITMACAAAKEECRF